MITRDIRATVITGEIERLVPLEATKAKRVILANVDIDGKSYRVRLKTYHFKGDDWRPGDIVSVKAKLLAPSGPVMPDGFDFSRKAYYEGIGAVGYTMADATLIKRAETHAYFVEEIRNAISKSIYEIMEPRYAAVAQALLTGERSGILKQDAENFRTSGLAHLLAISGLHIGLVAGCVFFFVRLFLACIPNMALYYPIKKWAAACAIIIVFCYMILSGATVPTVRAFIMTSLVLFAVILDRSALNMRLLALAALFVMITTPEAVTGPSFALSFSAVTALIVFYRELGRKWLFTTNAYKPLYRPFYYFLGIILTTLVATAATAPFSIMFFNRFALYSVLSNILAMPIMGFIVMPVGLLSVILIPTGLDAYIWFVMEWGIARISDAAEVVSNYEYASVPFPSFGPYETFLMCFGFIWLLLWKGYFRGLGLVLLIAAFVSSSFGTVRALYISEKMDAVLYVDNTVDELFLIGRMNSYLKDNWLGSLGYNKDVDISYYRAGDNMHSSGASCDDFLCRITVGQNRVTIVTNPLGLQRVCVNSDLVIAFIPIEKDFCEDVKVIDRFDVWRHGATTIRLSEQGYTIKTVK